jgi:tetratricopeptide (TPR) repeat protein
MNRFHALMASLAASAVLASCAGVGIPGFGDSSGCRTVYVYRTNGGIQPISNCGGLPRDTLMAQGARTQGLDVQSADGPESAPVTPVSAAAAATAPYDPVETGYPGPNEMLENADMSAFMARVRSDYARKDNSGAWGYMIIDALAADDVATAQAVLDAMAGRPPPERLNAAQLRPWVYAANGRAEDAKTEMTRARVMLPRPTVIARRALLAEGVGDTAGALAIYDEAPDEFDAPDEVKTPEDLARAMAFSGHRMLAMRQAELLRALDRNDEAVALLTRLAAAAPDDSAVLRRLEQARAGKDRRPVRTLKQAMAQAIADEADFIEEQQMIAGLMVGRGGKAPFNHLLSSMRQSALLLDPDNGAIRIAEVGALYTQGKFEPALRIAQIGNPPRDQLATLYSTAGLAALELGSPETLVVMTERALTIDSSPEAKVQAAGVLTSGGRTDRSIPLIDQALRQGLTKDQQVFALMQKGQAHLQAGNIAGAVDAGRAARTLDDNDNTKQFLASMLVESQQQRPEGLQIMRLMLAEQPENAGLMNNFGYSLIDGYADIDELDEGFRLLKQASRLTPDEPNLLDSLGWAYYQYGDFREARRFIQMALDTYEPFAHWELSDHMGDVLWRLEEFDKAREAWKHSLEAYPPAHNKAGIEAKIRDGLNIPAPVRRDTPEVPLTRGRGGVSDI